MFKKALFFCFIAMLWIGIFLSVGLSTSGYAERDEEIVKVESKVYVHRFQIPFKAGFTHQLFGKRVPLLAT